MCDRAVVGFAGRVTSVRHESALARCFRGVIIVYPNSMVRQCDTMAEALRVGDTIAYRARPQADDANRLTAVRGSVLVMSADYVTAGGTVTYVKSTLDGHLDGEYAFAKVTRQVSPELPVGTDVFFHRTALGSHCGDIGNVLCAGRSVELVAHRARTGPAGWRALAVLPCAPAERRCGGEVLAALADMHAKYGEAAAAAEEPGGDDMWTDCSSSAASAAKSARPFLTPYDLALLNATGGGDAESGDRST